MRRNFISNYTLVFNNKLITEVNKQYEITQRRVGYDEYKNTNK